MTEIVSDDQYVLQIGDIGLSHVQVVHVDDFIWNRAVQCLYQGSRDDLSSAGNQAVEASTYKDIDVFRQ